MHGMVSYFIRRILLIPITFVCITFLVYTVLRITPGGPVEQAILRMQRSVQGEAPAALGGLGRGEFQLTEKQVEALKKYYHLDRSIPVGYLIWLGLWPKSDGRLSGILEGDFGVSNELNEPVLKLISSKFPISLYFGLIGYFATWVICVPLGILKALRHRTTFDTATSVVVFLGYAIPGFVACLLLMVGVAAIPTSTGEPLLPLGDFRPPDWDARWAAGDYWYCITSQIRHTIIPVIGYLIGGFATMTVLMKNSLLENLGADYVRTALAKGLTERRVIFLHVLRNSLIPITTGIGNALGILFAGSFLIEKTCNINGMGLLGYTSLLARDYPVVMGILVFLVLIQLFGNIISDIVWALVDPRVRFGT